MINYLLVFLTAMTPIGELRAAIPIGLAKNLSIYWVYLIAIIGNLIPVIFILLLAKRFCPKWLCCRIEKKHNHKFIKWGELALIPFVALPLPLTGAWTGALAAVVFGVRFWRALSLISIGVIIAGIIVSLATLGFIKLL